MHKKSLIPILVAAMLNIGGVTPAFSHQTGLLQFSHQTGLLQFSHQTGLFQFSQQEGVLAFSQQVDSPNSDSPDSSQIDSPDSSQQVDSPDSSPKGSPDSSQIGSPNSSQKGSGVAGGSRVARGNSPSSPRVTPGEPESNIDEAVATLPKHRLREIEALEQQCLDEINQVRRKSGLTRLMFYEGLLPVARAYSRRMAEQHFFSHDDPEGRTVRERVDQADIRWRMIGENLAFSSGYVNPVAASLHGWMESPGHRRNILEPDFNLTAVGVWITSDGTVYFTEIFLRQ
jgi:uncharacterized protein YkwD